MFLIPTYLAASPIHGTGVFTPAPIAAGSKIWELSPPVDWEIPPEDLKRFPEPYRERLKMYCYLNEQGVYVLCGDNAKFMNHSDTPNCDDTGGIRTIALVDIPAHTELTCDYRTFDMESARQNGALYVEE